MRMTSWLIFMAIFTVFPTVNAEEITFETKDGVTLYADLYLQDDASEASNIILFHQGGGNVKAEYDTIWPKLFDAGYNILAVDMRNGGGERLGGINRTVAALGDVTYDYCEAQPDVIPSIQQLKHRKLNGPVILWGSSFSAALVINTTAEIPEQIAGTLAFSPASGGPLADCSPNRPADSLTSPIIIFRPGREMEIESVQKQFNLFSDAGHSTYIAKDGVHGSSMLNPKRVKGDTEGTWEAVFTFLKSIEK